ncbi:penicillin-binding protein 1A [Aestuariibacter sp. GS-14]|uniref:penicillin-binding protein 1A n=1 Tax=Aestuariibacter sp. GS-14 TaxID=2590670 RepID=UPI00112CC718|nr:penicillin-binding protein 1A [Aestuariibacter sp. GS-14]TPV58397.1 penicillin-binding protein 1A [Aestuariibacter sp. GS-14]
MKYIKILLKLGILAALLGSIVLTGIYFYIKPDLPSVVILKDVRLQTPMRIYTHDGKLISQYGVKRRIPVTLDETPDLLKKAILATEDNRFYEHFGIDPIGITRAFINLVVTGEKSQGASTLTQQLARGFFLTREKTFIRKIKEVFISFHMEAELTKDEIFELYLNKIELGHRSFGFGAAAQVYYGKKLDELTLAQMATLAGLPQAPSVLNPISRPERSLERRRIVLLRMLDEGYITRQQFDEALNEPVTAKKHGAEIEVDAPYLADLIYSEMVELYGKEEAETGGYQVYATADSAMQQAAQRAVKQNLHDYDERHGYRGAVARLWPKPDPKKASRQTDAALAGISVDECETPALYTNWPCDIRQEQIMAALDSAGAYGFVFPVAVTEVEEQRFITRDISGVERAIEWEGMDWARPFLSDNRQGESPQTAGEIVAPGDVVYIREMDGQWRLAQLPDVAGAFVALDPHNGAVQAIVGGYSFYQSQFNRATQAKRQVGSNIKPFIYSAALEYGYTIASVINDAPINEWDEATGVAWRPQNSPAEYDGPIRMRVALGKSKNVVSVRLLRGVGLDNTINHLTKFGLDRADIHRDETVSLGSSSHTPLEIVRGMAVIANGGYLIEPYFIDRVANEMGEVLWKHKPVVACGDCAEKRNTAAKPESEEVDIEALLAAELNQSPATQSQSEDEIIPAPQVISSQNAFLVAEMMRSAVRYNGSYSKKTGWQGTGWRASNILGREDLAGKTGTTNDSRDAWFSGFNRNLVATAWVGFDDMSRQLGRAAYNRPLAERNPDRFGWIGNALVGAESGANAAQPAWIRFMQVALDGVPEAPMPVPDDIVRVRIDRTSGKLTRRTDHTTLFEYFLRGTEPTVYVLEDDIDDPAQQDEESVDVEEIF